MKKTIFLLVIILSSGIIFAQNEIDALRYSEVFYGGTARSMGMANAFGALGADLSTASTNPAGIGIYKHSSATFSPSVMMSNVDATFNGTTTPADKLSVLLNNFGIVFSNSNTKGDLKSFNISVGYNRTNNFRHNYNITGVNNKGSMLDSYMINANGKLPSDMNNFDLSFRAWDTWLLDNLSGDTLSYNNALWWNLASGEFPKYGENQTKIQQVTGGAGEYFANFAINYKDFFFLGATIGFQSFSYNSKTIYSEDNFIDNSDLKSFTYTENLSDEGSGINLKIGFILKPTKFLRIGGAFHSPTFFTINDVYSTTMDSYWNSPDADGNYSYSSGNDDSPNLYKYKLLTPSRLTGDLGIILGKFLLIGINYEHVDYTTMRMSASDYLFVNENNAIRNTYKSTNNYRAGVEFHTGPIYLRGGYAMIGSPYLSTSSMNYSRTQITGGLGLKIGNFFIDASYVRDLSKYNSYLYNGYTDEPVPSISQNDGIINLTFGSRF